MWQIENLREQISKAPYNQSILDSQYVNWPGTSS